MPTARDFLQLSLAEIGPIVDKVLRDAREARASLEETKVNSCKILASINIQPLFIKRAYAPHATNEIECLTPREIAVLKLIADGQSTKELADTLGITFKTAVSHRTNILAKLKCHETASLVRIAIRAGLVAA